LISLEKEPKECTEEREQRNAKSMFQSFLEFAILIVDNKEVVIDVQLKRHHCHDG
jgi:hypothetical protein